MSLPTHEIFSMKVRAVQWTRHLSKFTDYNSDCNAKIRARSEIIQCKNYKNNTLDGHVLTMFLSKNFRLLMLLLMIFVICMAFCLMKPNVYERV